MLPAANVDPFVLHVDDDPVVTNVGRVAGIDSCLYLVRREHASKVVNAIACRWWCRGGAAWRGLGQSIAGVYARSSAQKHRVFPVMHHKICFVKLTLTRAAAGQSPVTASPL